jgi:hypothetical protein
MDAEKFVEDFVELAGIFAIEEDISVASGQSVFDRIAG